MKIRSIKAQGGETLVEVLAAFAVFLILMAVMQSAVSFCTNAQGKSKEIRRVNAEICRNFQTAEEAVPTGNVTLRFEASSFTGETGGAVLFEIETALGEKKVPFQDGEGEPKHTIFYLFLPADTNAGEPGGGEP